MRCTGIRSVTRRSTVMIAVTLGRGPAQSYRDHAQAPGRAAWAGDGGSPATRPPTILRGTQPRARRPKSPVPAQPALAGPATAGVAVRGVPGEPLQQPVET